MSQWRLDRPFRILLVEDNPGDVDLAREALQERSQGLEISVVSNGLEALSFLKREGKYKDAPRPDLILLDLNLPKLDGRQVLAQVKRDEGLKSIPVVVLTSSSAERDRQQAYALHANTYVTKPTDLGEYMERIQAIDHFWSSVASLPS